MTDALLTPFWQGTTMENETVTFNRQQDGRIIGKLLFVPDEIPRLTDWTLEKAYIAGKDYLWQPGTSELELPEGSAIPYFTPEDFTAGDLPPFDGQHFDALGRARIGNTLYCVSEYLYGRQLAASYTHSDAFTGPLANGQLNLLPRLAGRLKRREGVRIVYFGDSIFSGCDASSLYNRAPFMPPQAELVKRGLELHYGAEVTMINPSVGGMTSQWGKETAQERAADEKPDLVIIGFGQNDGPWPPENTLENVKAIIETVKATQPDCEFIVVASLMPNPASGFLGSQATQPALLETLSGPGIAYVNMYSLHECLLQNKHYADLTGNNINHPNDFFIRIYAWNILRAMQ